MSGTVYSDSETLNLSGEGTVASPFTGEIKPQGVCDAMTADPAVVAKLKATIDTIVTYVFGELVDDDPSDGVKKLILEGSNGIKTCVLIPDSTELPEKDTTYVLQVINDTITLVGSDGVDSGGPVTITTFDENFEANGDGSFTFTDDDGGQVTIPAPRTAAELCAAVVGELLTNSPKLAGLAAALAPLIDTQADVTVNDDGTFTVTNTLTGDSATTNVPTPPETDGVHVDGSAPPVIDLNAGTITWQTINDLDETAGPPATLDISGLIALLQSAAPTSPDGSITVVGDPQSGYTLETEDEDTRCSFVILADGSTEKTTQLYVNGLPDGAPVIETISPGYGPQIEALEAKCEALEETVADNTAAIAAIPPDTYLVSPLNIDTQAGTVTGQLNDGTPVTGTITGVPVEGAYPPAANGDVVIPTTGGGPGITLTGLVSPPDADIDNFSVALDPTGWVVTPTLADGSTLPPFTIPASTFAAQVDSDGCTLNFTHNGVTISVSLCDLSSNFTQGTNPDGSPSYTGTAADGSTITWTGALTYSVCYADGTTPDGTAANGQQFMDGPSLKARLVDPGFVCDANPANPDALVTAQQIRDWFKPNRYQSVNNTVVPLPPNTSVVHNTWTSPVCGIISRAHHVRIMHDPADLDLLGGEEIVSFILTPEGLSYTNEMTAGQRKEGTTIDPRMNAAGTSSVDVGDTIEHLIVSVAGAIPAQIRFSRMGAHLINPFTV